ncbi:MAG TPA: sulfite exporter TauE/SafE family protein, partial [Phycisphaerae bacterium]|nr:sulfite exporter TauE/SafE family protein [Phycisphaerae bacterium]
GAVAGILGSVVDLTGGLVGLQRSAAIAAGGLMVGFGVVTLLRVSGVKIKHLRLPGAAEKVVTAAHRGSMALPPMGRAVATGLLTTLLPCGWLYAFVITAAGTAHAATGALVMAAFWVGTLPALTVFGLGIQKLSAPLAKRLPAITASAIVAVGLYTIAARAQVQLSGHIDPAKPPCCQVGEGTKP